MGIICLLIVRILSFCLGVNQLDLQFAAAAAGYFEPEELVPL